MNPTVIEAIDLARDYLEKHGVESARLSAEHLLAKALDCDRLDLYLRFDERLERGTITAFRADLKKRSTHYPLQYILGEVEFFSLPFSVCEGVLIPRPETEVVVETVEELLGAADEIHFLEMGVGAGVIAGALAARHIGWRGSAFDVSIAAARCAARNLERIGVADRISVFAASGFGAVAGECCFDLLVSNPPYVPTGMIPSLQREIAGFEDRRALDGGSNGLDFYPRLADAGKTLLRGGGMIALEIGDGQAEDVLTILTEHGFAGASVRRDYNGRERVVTALAG